VLIMTWLGASSILLAVVAVWDRFMRLLLISREQLTEEIGRHNREKSCQECAARKLAFDPAKVLKLRPFSE
jgi:hypothetical protein